MVVKFPAEEEGFDQTQRPRLNPVMARIVEAEIKQERVRRMERKSDVSSPLKAVGVEKGVLRRYRTSQKRQRQANSEHSEHSQNPIKPVSITNPTESTNINNANRSPLHQSQSGQK